MLKQLSSVGKAFGGVDKVAEQAALATKEVGAAAESAGRSASKGSKGLNIFGNSIMRIVKYRIIRSIIRSITDAFKEGLQNLNEYSSAMSGEAHRMAETLKGLSVANQTMKNQIGSAWGELLSIILPYVQQIISAIAQLADWISQLFAAFSGHSNYYKAVDASADFAKNTAAGAASAKELRRQLMGFDEINRLDKPNEGGGGGGGGVANAVKDMFDYTAIDSNIQKIAQQIKASLPAIMAALAGFEFAIGAVLAFSGTNIPLGLALMALGAYTMVKAVGMDWNSVPPKVQYAVGAIMTVLTVGLMAIGAVMLLTGHVGVGLGMMLAGGAMAYATNAVFGKINPEVQAQLRTLAAIAAGALVGLGLVFMLLGHFGIGLAMILAGGAMGVTAMGLDWDSLLKKLKEVWKSVTDWYDKNVKKYFTYEYWDGLFADGILKPIEDFADKVGQWLSPVASWLDNIFAPRSASYKVDVWTGQWTGGLPGFASGGFPEDGFFYANHNEMVGQFSNGRTAVANNEEITEGIRRAVVEGMSQVLAGNNSNQNVNVYLDGKQITNAVTRNQRQMSRATGVAYG